MDVATQKLTNFDLFELIIGHHFFQFGVITVWLYCNDLFRVLIFLCINVLDTFLVLRTKPSLIPLQLYLLIDKKPHYLICLLPLLTLFGKHHRQQFPPRLIVLSYPVDIGGYLFVDFIHAVRMDSAVQLIGISRVHFEHKNACTPDIYLLIICFSIPDLRSHVVSTSTVGMLILFAEISDLSHPKVNNKQFLNLTPTIVIDDDVAGLDIAMKNAILPVLN